MNRPPQTRPVLARRAWVAVAAVMCVLGPAPAGATPPAGCSILSVGDLAFGTYDPFSNAPLDAVTLLQYDCPPGQPVRILIDAGQSGTFAARQLRSGAERLLYNLFLDAARSTVWGDGTGGSQPGPGAVTVGKGGIVSAPVYGRVFAGQDVAAGAYADVVHVTLEL